MLLSRPTCSAAPAPRALAGARHRVTTTQATYLMIGSGHVPRHRHSSNELITVLKGTFTVVHDGSADKTAPTPGGFLYIPAKMIHEEWTGNEGATYFIHGRWQVGCGFRRVAEGASVRRPISSCHLSFRRSLFNGYHQVLVGVAGPHHVRLRWVGIGRLLIAPGRFHGLRSRTNDHHV